MTKKVVTQAAKFSAASRYKERGLSCPLKYNSCEQQFVRKSAQLHGVAELSGEEFSAIE
jgi:hypothetical protein